ncbi:hypothetical protein [uncultured Enterococcus sp.]|nr:hypothetical protein [uncultured Enterococcus sp.]
MKESKEERYLGVDASKVKSVSTVLARLQSSIQSIKPRPLGYRTYRMK